VDNTTTGNNATAVFSAQHYNTTAACSATQFCPSIRLSHPSGLTSRVLN